MRILIVSDTHRRDINLRVLINKVAPIDMLIHCGDAEGSEGYIEEIARCPVYIVAGNNDYFGNLPREREFMIGSHKVFLTHGHNYYVYMSNEILKEEARARGADIVMYGHTHKPLIDIGRTPLDVTAINPGSLSYPRQEGRKPSYILMELDQQGKVHYHLNYMEI